MTPIVLSMLPKEDVELLEKTRLIVHAFPDGLDYGKHPDGEQIVLSCHILAGAIANIFCLDVKTGYFRPNYDHSWVKTPNGHIIDVYPVGILGGPFLVEQTASFISPGRHLYQPDVSVWERAFAKKHIKQAINIASNAALEVAKKLCLQ